MKTDARVRYTKMMIRNSFIQLLQKKPLNKITVKSICELSEINRTTFYKYYSDPYDLMQKFEDEVLEGLQKLIEESGCRNVGGSLGIILYEMKENPELYRMIFSGQGDHNFNDKLIMLCYLEGQSGMKHILPDLTLVQQEWFHYFLAKGCSSILDCWVQNGMKEEPLEVAEFINRLIIASTVL